MTYTFYELHPIITENGVYKNNRIEPKIVAKIDIVNSYFCEYMDDNFYEELYCMDFMNSLELDKYYYIIPEKGYDYCVFSPHKGYSFWDIAEHDDRVIIAAELNLDYEKMHI